MTPTLATSEFCGPCKMLKAELEKRNITVEYKDLSRDNDFFIHNKIKAVPTLVTVDGTLICGPEAILQHLTSHENGTGG